LEEFEKLDKALRVVERYEDYLFRRAMGVAFVVNGLIFPLMVLLALNPEGPSSYFNMDPEVFVPLATGVILLAGVSVIIYVFTSAHVVSSRLRKTSLWANSSHMILEFCIWFFSFYLTKYAPEPYRVVSWLWAGGFASLATYAFNRKTSENWSYPELIVVGVIVLVASIPILPFGATETASLISVAVLSISFFAAGIYSFSVAQRFLTGNSK
jgi:hypothetical protein